MPHVAIAQALRRLWHDRAITTIALAVLALGIGANRPSSPLWTPSC
jgi:hypothetical protein